MSIDGWIDARGWHASFITAPTDPHEIQARRALILGALEALEDALHPTALELEPGFFEAELGLLDPREAAPAVQVLAEEGSVVFSAVAEPDLLQPPSHILTRDDLRSALVASAGTPAPPEHLTDLVRVETIACGVLRLDLEVHWGPWAQPGTPEHEPFRDAVRKLLRSAHAVRSPGLWRAVDKLTSGRPTT